MSKANIKVMELALDAWARNLSMRAHEFLSSVLKPAFSAAYNAGALDQSRDRLDTAHGITAGFAKVQELASAIPVKPIKKK